MYTTTKTTREQALKAAAAANRAMERYSCCKSQFKFRCFSCGEMINRGEKITRCMRGSPTGMVLRYRGGDSSNGLSMRETAFYQGESGPNMWVHLGCKPCYWDSLPRDCNEYSPPSLRPITTEWGIRMRDRFPERTSMRDRIIHAITRIQAIWRGSKALKRIEDERCVMTPLTAGDIAMADALAEQKFLRETNVGHRFGILFNRGEMSEALYSGEIMSMCGEANGLEVYVRFHHDCERRKYHWKKFASLTFECNKFMEKMGITQFHGVIFTQKR